MGKPESFSAAAAVIASAAVAAVVAAAAASVPTEEDDYEDDYPEIAVVAIRITEHFCSPFSAPEEMAAMGADICGII